VNPAAADPAHREKPVRLNGTPQLLFFRIEQCLAKPPESRPSADSLLADLDRLANPVANPAYKTSSGVRSAVRGARCRSFGCFLANLGDYRRASWLLRDIKTSLQLANTQTRQ
jgi:hypothetical protein